MRLSARTIAERRASTGASGSGILTDIDLLQTHCVITAKHACAHDETSPVSRFRSSPEFAARSKANFGIEGHWPLYDSSAALNPKFAIGLAAMGCELRVRGTCSVDSHGRARQAKRPFDP